MCSSGACASDDLTQLADVVHRGVLQPLLVTVLVLSGFRVHPDRTLLFVEVQVFEDLPFVTVTRSQKTVLSVTLDVDVQSSSSSGRSSQFSIPGSHTFPSPLRLEPSGGSQNSQSVLPPPPSPFFLQQGSFKRRQIVFVMMLHFSFGMRIIFTNHPAMPSQEIQPQTPLQPRIAQGSGGGGNVMSPVRMVRGGGGPGGSGASNQMGKIGTRWSSSSS